MAKTIFVASAEPGSGKSVITIGLVNMLLCKAQKIGFFKPVINADPKQKTDVHIETILDYFAPHIEVERVGVAVEWRKGLEIMFRLFGAQRPR